MQLALTLLIAAMTLLTSVNNSPNLTPEFRLEAENVAQQAIDYAHTIIDVPQPVVQTPAKVLEPVFGSVAPVCVGNPVLTVATSSFAVTTVDYSTGCPLNEDTLWSYTNNSETNTRTIGAGSNVWYVNTSVNNDVFELSIYQQNSLHSISVGTTTKNF